MAQLRAKQNRIGQLKVAQLRPKCLAQLEPKWVAQLRPFYLSNLSEKDKRDLSSSLNQALNWSMEQKEKYNNAVSEWDQNHVKDPRPDGKPYLTSFTEEEN